MTWKKGQEVVVGSTRYYTHETNEHWRGTVEKLRPGGGCVAWGRNWRANGLESVERSRSVGDWELFDAAAWDAKVAEYKRLADQKAARAAEAKRQTAAWDRITHALRNATAEQYEALADELEARAPTFGTLAPVSWDVRVGGDRQAIELLDAAGGRDLYGHFRELLAAHYAEECDEADVCGEPRPAPPTVALVVEVVVDRWQP